ncbi:hypothetical protein WJ87_07850 [Burkholderia ubonensis]|nr:hypothetical protein WJ87_07850 [Burkholderia ubonensis]
MKDPNMKNLKSVRFPLLAAVLLGTIGLSACTSIGYRCPLNADEDSEYPTACSSMQEAMAGARKGTGGKTSVLMDDKGRLVPAELLENKPAKPLAAQSKEPFRAKSGDPVFHQPKVFQVWTGAFVDAEGNLHDGHTSWFSTPGRWAYGTVDRPGDVGNNTMRPALPDTRPTGRVVKIDPRTGTEVQAQPQQSATQSAQDREKAALQNLSSAANSAAANAKAQAAPQPQVTSVKPATAAPGVTAPAVGLSD